MKNKIWVLGDAVVDLIPDGDNHYLRCAGGAPANVAVAVARLGGKSAFIGRVGKDPLGEFMQRTLMREQVDTRYMKLDPEQRTSTVVVGLTEEGERSFTFMVNPSADQFLQIGDLPAFDAGDWLHCCSIALINEPSRTAALTAMQNIAAVGGKVSFDPNLRESLWSCREEMIEQVMRAVALAHVVKFSEEELCLLTRNHRPEQAFAEISARYPEKLIIVTLGKQGAKYHIKGHQALICGKALKAVDTTGAGDAFVGGLLAGLAQTAHWQTEEALSAIIRQANACGALAVTAKGAMSALPTQSQLARFLAD
ncbi:fructokinase [Mesocricetibacter intestinalis]|uniref:Fructokinase n=1 Tax=Mesocricetibacter intestinalis TaxID=1521930 RepID=A0A4R6VB17_9PAST|nr:aminoimidazole riboside kinase [Mesocricetibacter intestinalis]TDQ57204.1 fructokinase [Mesocricetibacter intestinalis]